MISTVVDFIGSRSEGGTEKIVDRFCDDFIFCCTVVVQIKLFYTLSNLLDEKTGAERRERRLFEHTTGYSLNLSTAVWFGIAVIPFLHVRYLA